MRTTVRERFVATLVVALALVAAALAPSSGAIAEPIGPKAVVEGRLGGPVKVTVRLLNSDAIRVCFKGSGVADSLATWASPGGSGKHRRSAYDGSGCTRFNHSFAPNTTVRYRACFADPREPQRLYCGSWRHAKTA